MIVFKAPQRLFRTASSPGGVSSKRLKNFEKQPENLTFQNRLDILLKIMLISIAEKRYG